MNNDLTTPPSDSGSNPSTAIYTEMLAEIKSRIQTSRVKVARSVNRELIAQQLLKDPYNFDFLGLSGNVSERELENALIDHLRTFLIELGKGFAFVGQQYHLEVGGQDFYIDLLFYHVPLGCYVVIDLEVEDFKPEFAGKMSLLSHRHRRDPAQSHGPARHRLGPL